MQQRSESMQFRTNPMNSDPKLTENIQDRLYEIAFSAPGTCRNRQECMKGSDNNSSKPSRQSNSRENRA